jgi:lipopolysaccharide/colanic/teichoic acid biosynthesis glycosyltransferase
MLKRSCDVVLAFIGLVLLSPLFLLLAVLIKLESPGPVFFRQTRVGKGFRTFTLFKFRTMRVAESSNYELGYELTCGNDERITRFGALLRRTKFDETPQLWNVLRGEMSIVGPRPQTPALVESMRDHYAAVLCANPGMTDLASIRFRGESDVLGNVDNPVDYYLRIIMPEKMELQQDYLRRRSLMLDLWIIWCTALVCLGSERTRRRIEVVVARRMYRRRRASSANSMKPAGSMKPAADGELSSVGD